ncbi:MAG: putative diheme cytochrome c-553 [Myxococcaceae bacterium]|nr:putative diheme cytochrome c-553 [Myxococcaceae bacterium]
MAKFRVTSLVLLSALGGACTDDSDEPLVDGGKDGGTTVHTDGGIDASVSIDAGVDSGTPVQDSGLGDAQTPADGGTLALVARGKYIVEHVAACGDCHTPRTDKGAPDLTRFLAGQDCFADAFPGDDTKGCLSSRNLTNHETGLKNRSDAEIKDMFLKGTRPDGKYLHPIMPYSNFGNMSAADADAIVAFLRTVPPVDHMVKAAQFPFADVPAPAPTWPDALIPRPRPEYPDQAAALRGRYLAGSIGVCMECHTAHDEMDIPLVMKPFEGGRAFPSASLGIPPGSGFPDVIYSSNITPDETGIKNYDVAAVVTALKQGIDEEHKPLCPPMPAGPMAAFGGLTDADAQDIAHYLLSLPPKANTLPNICTPPGAL